MPKYTMKQLSEESGFSARTIRYYITQGLVPKSVGQGKKAYYTDEHLGRLREIKLGTESGLRLDQLHVSDWDAKRRAREAERAVAILWPTTPSETWQHYKLAPGVVLTVRSDISARKIRRSVKAFAKELKEK